MFDANLQIALTLRSGRHQHEVPGSRVKSCALELRPHGFEARVTFWSEHGKPDELTAWFVERELMQVELQLGPVDRPESEARIELHGLVADKALVENVVGMVGHAQDAPVLVREYTVRVVDPAALLWRQHHPLELRAEAKLEQLITEQLVDGITLDIDLDDARRTRPMVCIATDERTSFYDYLVAYADRAGGAFYYDYWKKSYRLGPERQGHAGKARLQRLDVASLRLELPATPRHGARVLNGHSEAAHITAVDAPAEALTGLSRDRLIRTPSGADVDACNRLEATRLRPAEAELEIEQQRLGDAALMPGAEAQLDGELFTGQLYATGKSFRVCALSLAATVNDGDQHDGNDGRARRYDVTLHTRWESATDQRPRLPPHAPPAAPLIVEGKIVADGGGEHDRTFMAGEDRASGEAHYVVHVPLWNQKIHVPFQPHFLPGHFFAPAFKGSRVLVALHFEHAEILQFLDWGPDVRLPSESQGNHLLFGKNATSQTSLKHVYVDDKPVFSLSRVAQADHGRLQLEEGTLVLEIKEDPGGDGAGETHDLTAQVATGQEQLHGGAQNAVEKIEGATQQSCRALDGKLSAARANLTGALDGLVGELGGRSEQGKAELQACLDNSGARLPELRGAVDEALAELQRRRA